MAPARPEVDGMVSSRWAEESLCGACDDCGELGIVRTALNHRLPFDKGLILPVQIKTRLDCYRAVCAKPLLITRRVRKVAHSSPGIGIQPECPFDSISRGAAVCGGLETPLAEPDLRHVQ